MLARFLKGAAVATVVAALLVPASSPVSAHHAEGPCDMHRIDDEGVRHFSKRLIRCAVRHFGPVGGGMETAICIAERESDLLPDAESPTGMYLGLFQHAAEYWPDRYRAWTRNRWGLPESALSGRTNAVVTIRMVSAAGGWRKAGWRRGEC